MKIPFLDLKAQYQSIDSEINDAIQDTINSCAFAGGPFVEKFEKEFAAFCECGYAIGVSNGTEALWLALLGFGIGAGDEVITVPNTFIATAEAISFSGATPVFVDIGESTYNMNPENLSAFIEKNCVYNRSSNTLTNKSSQKIIRAVIPVHLYGQMADMDPIKEIADAYGLKLIEDASQAHGAEYKGRVAGSISDAACFSFYPGKNLGAFGEAGAVVTNNADFTRQLGMIRDHGQSKKYYHELVGWNARMDGIQASVLSVKLKYLKSWNNGRRRNAKMYHEMLADVKGVTLPHDPDHLKSVYHIYPIRVRKRDSLISALSAKGISCGIHYPVPIHLQGAYSSLGLSRGSFPVAEKCADEVVSLPMYPELDESQIKYVSDSVKAFLSG